MKLENGIEQKLIYVTFTAKAEKLQLNSNICHNLCDDITNTLRFYLFPFFCSWCKQIFTVKLKLLPKINVHFIQMTWWKILFIFFCWLYCRMTLIEPRMTGYLLRSFLLINKNFVIEPNNLF